MAKSRIGFLTASPKGYPGLPVLRNCHERNGPDASGLLPEFSLGLGDEELPPGRVVPDGDPVTGPDLKGSDGYAQWSRRKL